MKKIIVVIGLLSLLCIGSPVKGAAVMGSLFDPDAYTMLNSGNPITINDGETLVLNTTTGAVSGPGAFADSGSFDVTAGGDPQSIAIFTFSTVTINTNATISITGNRPFAILARNSLTFNGVIDISGAGGNGAGLGGSGNAGGADGGSGRLFASGFGGGGDGGGAGGGLLTGGGGGSHAGSGTDGVGILGGSTGSLYGDSAVSDLKGGSGGGAGGGDLGLVGNGGGAGGGAGVLIAQDLLVFGGTINAEGGDGSGSLLTGGGGAGSGGSILLAAPEITLESGLLDVSGGAGGDTSILNADGGEGGGGRIAYYYGPGGLTDNGVNLDLDNGELFDNEGLDFPNELTLVPEPSTTLFLCLAALGLVLRRGRR